ncbi:MAG: DUF3419 family protein, partial [Myxococcota bacterium]
MRSGRFFDTLNYSSQNEDWRAEARGLGLHDGQRVLTITGSGDRALNLLAMADVDIVAIDAAPAQNHLLRIKMAALAQLAFDDYAAFLGLTDASGTARTRWATLLDVPPGTRAWMGAHRRDIAAGLLYRGRFERWFGVAGRLARLVRGPAIRTLMAFDDLDAQRRFLDERWDRWWWRAIWAGLCHPIVTRLTFGDPAFYDHVDVPVGQTLFDRIRQGLDHVLARESFMVALVLTGRLSPHDLPPYLTPEGAATIRGRLAQLRVVDGDVLDVLPALARETHFDALSLSDLPSFLGPPDVERLLCAARDALRPAGRVVLRQFLTRQTLVPPPGLRRLPTLDSALA